jgi:O-antigen/teichoic acid export membrane protein
MIAALRMKSPIVRHTVFNLVGMGLPLVVAVVCIPPLIEGLGTARFGLLTMIWAVVSYFGLFDLGLGRALTQQLAAEMATAERARIGPLVGTATLLMAGLGGLAGGVMAVLASWGVDLINGVPNRTETIAAVYAMAFAMPVIVLTSAFRGTLEAYQAFGIINVIRIPMGVFTFVGPLVVLQVMGPRLDVIAWVLAGGRFFGCFLHGWCTWRILGKDLIHGVRFSSDQIRPLCSAGGWMTVTNVVSPLMGYLDRFVIGALLSPAAVALYATPQEIVTRLSIIPGALTAVLFPAFASSGEQAVGKRLFRNGTLGLGLVLLPLVVPLIVFAHPLLALWISEAFAQQAAMVFQIFSVGMFINCLAHIPYAWLQGVGRSRSVAMVHLAELPLFIGILSWLVMEFGVPGAAVAWLIRVTTDAIALFSVSLWAMRSANQNSKERL